MTAGSGVPAVLIEDMEAFAGVGKCERFIVLFTNCSLDHFQKAMSENCIIVVRINGAAIRVISN